MPPNTLRSTTWNHKPFTHSTASIKHTCYTSERAMIVRLIVCTCEWVWVSVSGCLVRFIISLNRTQHFCVTQKRCINILLLLLLMLVKENAVCIPVALGSISVNKDLHNILINEQTWFYFMCLCAHRHTQKKKKRPTKKPIIMNHESNEHTSAIYD